MKQLVLHVGYPKTATTALQQNIFSQLPGEAWEVISPEQKHCLIPHLQMKRILQGDSPPLNEIVRASSKSWLISVEGLLFDCIRDLQDGRLFRPRSWERTLQGMREFYQGNEFDSIQILIWLRKQDELIHSVYAQSYQNFFSQVGELDTMAKYVKRILTASSTREPLIFAYHFSNVLKPLFEQFGERNVAIFFYEAMEASPDSELDRLGKLVGFDFGTRLERTNVRRVGASVKVTRPATFWDILLTVKKRYLRWLVLPSGLKRLLRDMSAKVVLGDGRQISLSEVDRELIMATFSKSNKELESQIGLKLPKGYY